MHVELKPIKTKKIYEEIVDQIKLLISEGQLRPGDKLPSERELVESFKVSRSSIREALSALEMMGIIEVRTGEGAFIRHPASIISSLAWMLNLDRESVAEMLEARKMIEIQAVGYAAERATLQEIDHIAATLKNKGSVSEEEDIRFHYTIALATHNKITIRLMDIIFDNIHHFIRVTRPKIFEGKYTPELLYQEHLNIYEAIRNRDGEEAKRYMFKHLCSIEEEILKTS